VSLVVELSPAVFRTVSSRRCPASASSRLSIGIGQSPLPCEAVQRRTNLDDRVAKLEIQSVVAGPVRNALSNGELEQAADAVEVGVNTRDLTRSCGTLVSSAVGQSSPRSSSSFKTQPARAASRTVASGSLRTSRARLAIDTPCVKKPPSVPFLPMSDPSPPSFSIGEAEAVAPARRLDTVGVGGSIPPVPTNLEMTQS